MAEEERIARDLLLEIQCEFQQLKSKLESEPELFELFFEEVSQINEEKRKIRCVPSCEKPCNANFPEVTF